MEAYNGMDIEKAGSMLEEALRIANEAGVMGPLRAQTNLNLGIVYVGGLSDNDSGVRYFMDAICSDPSVQLDPLTSTPDVQGVFQVAGQRVQQAGCQGGPPIAPGAAAQTMPMQPGPQGYAAEGGGGYGGANPDDELPPGWGQADTQLRAKEFKRAFLQVGLSLGMTYIHSGMLADRAPPYDRIFISRVNGGAVTDLYDEMGNVVRDMNGQPIWNVDDLRFPGTKIGVTDPVTGEDVGLASANAWVPDADSTDGYFEGMSEDGMVTKPNYVPIGGPCPADGKQTGPGALLGDEMAQLEPSRYCVRVKKPGFATGLALRAGLGFFVTRSFALSVITRLQFSSGQGEFANLLVGGRGEYMFTKPRATGLMISGFFGGTFGQIQAQPSTKGATGDEPWIKSGLMGAHVGVNVRYRFDKWYGVFMAPEFDVQFPTFLWHIDLTLLGAELAF